MAKKATKQTNDFLDYQWETVDESHQADERQAVGPGVQWWNGSDIKTLPDGVQFGGFEIPVDAVERFAHTMPDFPVYQIPHGESTVDSYLMPAVNLCVVNSLFLYEAEINGQRVYSKQKGQGTGRVILYCYIAEFAPYMPQGTPFIVSLKGATMAQYFAARRQFENEVIKVGAEIIKASKKAATAPKLPGYMFHMPLTTTGREWRQGNGQTYAVAPLVPAWDSEIATSTLDNIHPDLSTLKIDGDLHSFINLVGWQSAIDWKAETEQRLLEGDSDSQNDAQPMPTVDAIQGMNQAQLGGMLQTKDQLTDAGQYYAQG